MSSSASATVFPGASVTGSTIIPDSERFTLSTSATWSSIARLRWTMPMPPARASAIARRASVTVSIAAETTGIESSSSRVSRDRVDTSFGSTSEDAGTSRTSSKARPSRANLSSSARRRSTSTRPSSNPSKENSLTPPPAEPCTGETAGFPRGPPSGLRRRLRHRRSRLAQDERQGATAAMSAAAVLDPHVLELPDLDVRLETGGLLRIEATGSDLERGGRTGGDGLAEGILGRPSRDVRGDVGGQEDVTAADARDSLDLWCGRAVAPGLAAVAQPCEAAALVRD